MKKILMISLILLLSACGTPKTVESSLMSALSMPNVNSNNQNKRLYSYYLPPYVGLKVATETSSIVYIENQEVLINLKISDVVGKTFAYDKKMEKITLQPSFSKNISYVDKDYKSHPIYVRVYDVDDKNVVFIDNDVIEMIGIIDPTKLNYTLETMVTILKSVDVDRDLVVASYSNKHIKEKSATYSEFFEQIPPESGTLKEMYEQLDPNRER